jgi:hypothetical protein
MLHCPAPASLNVHHACVFKVHMKAVVGSSLSLKTGAPDRHGKEQGATTHLASIGHRVGVATGYPEITSLVTKVCGNLRSQVHFEV